MRKIFLDIRQQFDLFGLKEGLFHPVKRLMGFKEALDVSQGMRYHSHFFPLPIILRLTTPQVRSLANVNTVSLCDKDQTVLAELSIDDIFPWNIHDEAIWTLGTSQKQHPHYQWLCQNDFSHGISGNLVFKEQRVIPKSGLWNFYYRSPGECVASWKERGLSHVVGFQTRNPLHRSHMALIEKAVDSIQEPGKKGALLHPVIGPTQEQDIDPHTRMRLYQMCLPEFKKTDIFLSLLPISMRMAGPREACWHAIIRKNVGCTHFIVGRDHAGPTPKQENGKPFYEPFAAQEMALRYEKEMGIKILAMPEMVYDKELKRYESAPNVPVERAGQLSGTALRKAITEGSAIPEWFAIPAVEAELRRVEDVKRRHRGVCIYAFGISGSGKTTTLKEWIHLLKERGFQKPITLLDGDEIRQEWSPDLGFSPEERKLHVWRIGKLATTIVEHGGIVFVANIAPFNADRDHNRQLISSKGHYFDIFFDIPIDECAKRDVKGFYQNQGIQKMNVFEKPTHTPSFIISQNQEHLKTFNKILFQLRDIFGKEFPVE